MHIDVFYQQADNRKKIESYLKFGEMKCQKQSGENLKMNCEDA